MCIKVVLYLNLVILYNVTKGTRLYFNRAICYMDKNINKLIELPSFTTKDAENHGCSRRMLSYYVKTGMFERIARGVYRATQYQTKDENLKWEDLAIAASNIKGGIICLVSALVYYELTDEMMREYWIAVKSDNTRVKFPMCNIIRMRNVELGVQEIKLAGIKVNIFDMERTIIDSFRLLRFETAMKALKLYLNGSIKKPDYNKLGTYIKELRASKVKDYIMALKT